MSNQVLNDKVFLEKKEKIRIIVEQSIGLEKIINLIKEEYPTEVFRNNENIIIFIEEKTIDN